MGEKFHPDAPPCPPISLRNTSSVEVVDHGNWDHLVQRLCGDRIYHSLAYHRVSALLESEGAFPVLLRYQTRSEELALPLLLRPLPDGSGWDATSAYGYGGPISTTDVGLPGLGPAIDEWARRNRLVSTFIRYHPLLGNHTLSPPGPELTRAGLTVAWDLTAGRDLMQSMHRHHRRAARKADRHGMVVQRSQSPGDLSAFRKLYTTTMRRRGARPFYYFPDGYWEQLVEHCRSRLLLFTGLREDKEVASMLCFRSGPYIHYHLGATSDEGRHIGASNRLFLAAAEYGREEGHTTFHLGGGVAGSAPSTLLMFKHRFDPRAPLRPFYVGKWVHNWTRYRRLAGSGSTAGYFPPWRE